MEEARDGFVIVAVTFIRKKFRRQERAEVRISDMVNAVVQALLEDAGLEHSVNRPHVVAIDGDPVFDQERIPKDAKIIVIKTG